MFCFFLQSVTSTAVVISVVTQQIRYAVMTNVTLTVNAALMEAATLYLLSAVGTPMHALMSAVESKL